MQLDRAETRDPEQGGQVIDDAVVADLPAPETYLCRPHPLRASPAFGGGEAAAVDAGRETSQGQGTVSEVGKQDGRYAAVVVDEVALGEPGRGEQHALEVGQLDRARGAHA